MDVFAVCSVCRSALFSFLVAEISKKLETHCPNLQKQYTRRLKPLPFLRFV